MSDDIDDVVLFLVIKKILGSIGPVGSTDIDDSRFDNLQTFAAVTRCMVDALIAVRENCGSSEYSRNRAGKYADTVLLGIASDIEAASR